MPSTAATILSDVESIFAAGSNPISAMLSGVKIASTALPTIFAVGSNIAQHLPTIQAKFADLEAELEKAWNDAKHLDLNSAEADLGAAYKDGMDAYAAVGVPRSAVQTVIAAATGDNKTPEFIKNAIAAGESIAKQLGLPI